MMYRRVASLASRGSVTRFDDRVRGDAGDTLLEILIAIVILSLSVAAILGMLVTTITTASEHRSLATDNTVLESFAEGAKYEVQYGPASTSRFANCAKSYLLASSYPSSGTATSTLTVFATGFPPTGSPSVTVGTKTVRTLRVVKTSSYPGDFTASGELPAGLAATQQYSVKVTEAPKSVVTATKFLVTAAGTKAGNGVANVKLHLHVLWWGPKLTSAPGSTLMFRTPTTPTATPKCTATSVFGRSNIQELRITAKTANGVKDTVLLVVTNPVGGSSARPRPAPGVAVTASPSSGVHRVVASLTFSLTLTGSATGGAPTGTVEWQITAPGTSTCTGGNTKPLTASGNSATATCTINTPGEGDYEVTASYSGSAEYSPTAGYGEASITPTDSLAVSVTPSSPVATTTLKFKAVVSGLYPGGTPTGSVSWTFDSDPSGPLPTCANSTLQPSGGNTATTSTATECTVTNAIAGKYVVTAKYSGEATHYTPVILGTFTVTVGP
jgi:type II secretory pathway pseudopilin PulG